LFLVGFCGGGFGEVDGVGVEGGHGRWMFVGVGDKGLEKDLKRK
jgi:hypothetical protein